MSRILIKISDSILYIACRVIFKDCSDIIMEIDPVLPVQEEYTDSNQICDILMIIGSVDHCKALWLFCPLADDLFQQMPRILVRYR